MHTRFRVLTLILLLISLIPAPALFGHTSPLGTILGGYTVQYLVMLIGYSGYLLGLAVLLIFIRPVWAEYFRRPLHILQRYPPVIILLLIGLMESWYYIRSRLDITRFFGEPGSADFQMILISTGLLAIYAALVLIFGAREKDSLRETAINLTIVTASSLIAFAIFSIGYVLFIEPEEYQRAHSTWKGMQAVPEIGALSKPNLQDYGHYFPESGEFVPMSTNSEGFRGADPSENPRIAVIGDSFMFSEFVTDEEMWRPKLEAQIGQPVANYSMIGINFQQYHLLHKIYVDKGEHDLVIFVLYANDYSIYYGPGEAKVDVRPVRRALIFASNPFTYTFASFFYNHSPATQIGTLFQEAQAARNAPPPVTLEYDLAPVCEPQSMADGWGGQAQESLQADLDIVIERAAEKEHALLFVLIPTKVSVYSEILLPVCDQQAARNVEKEHQAYEWTCRYLAEQGIPCYDMTADFIAAAHSTDQPLYFSIDGHWNAAGHQVFADLLAAYLEDNGLLP